MQKSRLSRCTDSIMEKTGLAMRRRSTNLENDHASRSPDYSTIKVGPSNTSTVNTAQDHSAPAALQGRVPAAPLTDNTGRLLDSYAVNTASRAAC